MTRRASNTMVQSTSPLALMLFSALNLYRGEVVVIERIIRSAVPATAAASSFRAICVAGPSLILGTLLGAIPAKGRASDVPPSQVVESFEGTFGVHPGQRRNHAKGTCATGEFVGEQSAQELSRSALFSGTTISVLARFSVGGGNPEAADVDSSLPRGMALEFHLPGGALQHMTMVNEPIFGGATPASFNDALIAAHPDPKTGKPDPKKLSDFLASHPDARPLAEWSKLHGPTATYYQSTYYSIHTFEFVDAKNVAHPVKWRFVPHDGVKELSPAQIASAPHDFLEKSLIERVHRENLLWDMVVYVGESGDPLDNPSLAWPESRRHFVAGTLIISDAMPQHGAACENVNFDPLVLADGIAPSNDPVLLFRSPAYAVSFGKRVSGQ
jgi:catalase